MADLLDCGCLQARAASEAGEEMSKRRVAKSMEIC
jgi:hypothetical protein